MDQSRFLKSSHKLMAKVIVNEERAEESFSASQLKEHDPVAADKRLSLSVRGKILVVLAKDKILQSLLQVLRPTLKFDTVPNSLPMTQDGENKHGGFRFVITINRLAKSILIYLSNPIWHYIGISILPAMKEYRDAWVSLLKALIKHTKLPRRYTCFLTLLPKALTQDLTSILKKLPRDLAQSKSLDIRNTWRKLWRSPGWQYSELRPNIAGWEPRESYDASEEVWSDLFIGLSNIQYFAVLFSTRIDASHAAMENSVLESPIDMQVERVKEVLLKMSEASQMLGRKLESKWYSCEGLDYTLNNSAS